MPYSRLKWNWVYNGNDAQTLNRAWRQTQARRDISCGFMLEVLRKPGAGGLLI
jgi:hypothetical protein